MHKYFAPAALLLAAVSIVPAAAPQAMTMATTAASQPMVRLKPPAVGDKAPDFTLQTLDKKEVHLAELLKSGPVVVIELRGWVGYQCPYCTQQTREFISAAKDFAAAGAKVVLVYPGDADGLEAHAQEFITGKGLPDGFLFVTDPGKKFVGSWGLMWNKTGETAYPSTFIVDKTGGIKFSKVSDNHAGRATAGEVLKALGESK
ncbi:MAG TPA: redoxin family protein [Phycisphaerae bacterium]|nr:redoxin family protein [Phycisphaerae bacterium]